MYRILLLKTSKTNTQLQNQHDCYFPTVGLLRLRLYITNVLIEFCPGGLVVRSPDSGPVDLGSIPVCAVFLLVLVSELGNNFTRKVISAAYKSCD